MSDAEWIPLSGELLAVMRGAAQHAGALNEPFITIRTLLLALLDDPQIGPVIAGVLPREALEGYTLPDDAATRLVASRVQEPNLEAGERPAMLRFDTLAFKLPGGEKSVWLSREANAVWNEGAKRVEAGAKYLPKHLAFGIAADAVRAPGVLAHLRVEPGKVTEALLNLP
jgi:hypothetical protein